jgi:hypothetical protein
MRGFRPQQGTAEPIPDKHNTAIPARLLRSRKNELAWYFGHMLIQTLRMAGGSVRTVQRERPTQEPRIKFLRRTSMTDGWSLCRAAASVLLRAGRESRAERSDDLASPIRLPDDGVRRVSRPKALTVIGGHENEGHIGVCQEVCDRRNILCPELDVENSAIDRGRLYA